MRSGRKSACIKVCQDTLEGRSFALNFDMPTRCRQAGLTEGALQPVLMSIRMLGALSLPLFWGVPLNKGTTFLSHATLLRKCPWGATRTMAWRLARRKARTGPNTALQPAIAGAGTRAAGLSISAHEYEILD
jgi:hypothetical protein